MQPHDLTLTELAAGLSAKKFSSREIVDVLLARVAKADGKLHAFTEVYAREAKALADAADTARACGFPLGPLHGLPVVYKDLCDIAGRVGTGGSKMWEKRRGRDIEYGRAIDGPAWCRRQAAHGRVCWRWGTNPLMARRGTRDHDHRTPAAHRAALASRWQHGGTGRNRQRHRRLGGSRAPSTGWSA